MKGKFGIAWGGLDRRWRREAVRFHFLGGFFFLRSLGSF